MNADELALTELDLLFYLARGYTGFEYYEKLKCWRIEKPVFASSKILQIGVVPDDECSTECRPYLMKYSSELAFILRDMQDEGIALTWGPNGNYCLHFQAFPEIKAQHWSLIDAFKRVMIKKELGDFISIEDISRANISRERVNQSETLKI